MLVLVVGPSGAGKDTLLDLARERLGGERTYRFVRRVITRPENAGGEAHEAVDAESFEALRATGGFALWWEAHGLRYGIPADIAHDVAEGRVVVASVSRGVIDAAQKIFPTRVIEITCDPAVRAQRLASRGREAEADVIERLQREVPLPADLERDVIFNDGTPAEGAEKFIAALRRAAEDGARG
jgi:phosphonate metabolism protein PhnN/1,5-bisphosphokinase (PRPP-forming)